MTMKYYQHDISPPCRMVTMVMKVLELKPEVVSVNPLLGETRKPEFLAINPKGKIPCLKDGDFLISESQAIATYLCNKYEKGEDSSRLYPVKPEARGTVDEVLSFGVKLCDTLVEYANIAGIFARNEKSRNDSKLSDVENLLKICEGLLNKNGFMAGSQLTLADFSIATSLTLLSLTNYDGWKNYTKLQAWLIKIKALPYYDEVNKSAMEGFVNLYKEKINS